MSRTGAKALLLWACSSPRVCAAGLDQSWLLLMQDRPGDVATGSGHSHLLLPSSNGRHLLHARVPSLASAQQAHHGREGHIGCAQRENA